MADDPVENGDDSPPSDLPNWLQQLAGSTAMARGRDNPEEMFTYGQNAARNAQWAKPGPYQTQLSPADEMAYINWMKEGMPHALNDLGYDMRGYWQAKQAGDPRAQVKLDPGDHQYHFPDVWKTPSNPTFSDESIYAKPGAPQWRQIGPGYWVYQTPDGHVIYDGKMGRWFGAPPQTSGMLPSLPGRTLSDAPGQNERDIGRIPKIQDPLYTFPTAGGPLPKDPAGTRDPQTVMGVNELVNPYQGRPGRDELIRPDRAMDFQQPRGTALGDRPPLPPNTATGGPGATILPPGHYMPPSLQPWSPPSGGGDWGGGGDLGSPVTPPPPAGTGFPNVPDQRQPVDPYSLPPYQQT